jgi:uncharacterized protein
MPEKNSKKITDRENRMLTVRSVQMETREDGGKKYISGFIPYDSMSEDLGGFIEIIRQGAFTKSLQEADIRCLWNHDAEKVCGRSGNSTLTLEDRADGLHFEAELPAVSWAGDLFASVSRRDAPGVSFGFIPVKDRWTFDDTGNGNDTRELLEVRLFEVSVGVTFPAYPESSCSASTRELAQQAGINLDVIGKVLSLRKYKKDYICGDTEAAQIRAIIGSLTELLPEDKPETEEESRSADSSKPDGQSTCEERERDLALLELEAEI